MKERKEGRDRMNVRHGNLGPHGQIFHLVGWEVAELFLYRSEVVEYQTVIICISAPPKCKGGVQGVVREGVVLGTPIRVRYKPVCGLASYCS